MFNSLSHEERVPLTTPDREGKALLASPASYSFLHMPGEPFCPSDRCSCHHNQAQIAILLEAVKNGEMTLREAANVADGKTLRQGYEYSLSEKR